MSEERKCPVFFETKMYKSPPCNGKILRKEPLLSPEKSIKQVRGPIDINTATYKPEESFDEEKTRRYFIYECEHGHFLDRPEGWADVPTVPSGTIKSSKGSVNIPPTWYLELSDEEKEKYWK